MYVIVKSFYDTISCFIAYMSFDLSGFFIVCFWVLCYVIILSALCCVSVVTVSSFVGFHQSYIFILIL